MGVTYIYVHVVYTQHASALGGVSFWPVLVFCLIVKTENTWLENLLSKPEQSRGSVELFMEMCLNSCIFICLSGILPRSRPTCIIIFHVFSFCFQTIIG